ncbi:DUF6382 domain-containing protein [Paenibacillus anaericanus]|nr:DUF6382 domain-containing protein [Paenibacillus anaericanus]
MMGLHVDYVRDGGTFMILRAEGHIEPQRINLVQKEMLMSISVPGLLRLDIREVDYKVSLHYDITGRRMLSQCLKSDKMSMPEFYSLLLQIITVLDDSKGYMLSPGNYILEEEFIFVEEPLTSGILYLTYVPLKEPLIVNPVHIMLLGLITRLMTSISHMEGNGIQKILSFCRDDLFSIPALKRMLIELLADDEPTVRHKSSHELQMQSKYEESRAVIKEYLPSYSQSAVASERVGLEYSSLRRNESNESPIWKTPQLFHSDDNDTLADSDESGSDSPKHFYYIVGAILIDALCWKLLYLDHPVSLNLYICMGLTLVFGVAVLLIRAGKLQLPVQGMATQLAQSNSTNFDDQDQKQEEITWKGKKGQRGKPKVADFDEKWRWNDVGDVTFPNAPRENPQNAHKQQPQSPRLTQEAYSTQIDYPTYVSNPIQEPYPAQIPYAIPKEKYNDSVVGIEIGPPVNPATVLLKRPMVQDRDSYSLPLPATLSYLERYDSTGGGTQRIALKTGSFVIGRSEEIVQYVEKAVGVSRAHVELMITTNGCSLKDLGSKNGTKLKGELIAPYKDYPLEAGDVFSIADTSFKCCKEGM